jgi:hypothetical protein
MHQSISAYLNSGGELDEGNVLGYRLEGFDQRREVDLWRYVLVADDDNRFSLRTRRSSSFKQSPIVLVLPR